MKNSIVGETTKGCIFFNNKIKLCNIHKVRPYVCYLYGITPELEFNIRFEKMKELYKDIPSAVIKEQCELVSTCNGEKITIFQTNKWWNELIDIEKSIGIKKDIIHDKEGGSYRTPHDHLLLFLMPDNVLSSLAGINMYDNIKDKIITVSELMSNIRKFYKNE